MNQDNTVFYSSANSGYIQYAATSLVSIRRHIPSAKLFILSSGMTDKEKALLHKMDIGFHEVDFTDGFYQTWQYPVDCYYLFAGPEIFLKIGYKYSVYVDGDILCKGNPLVDSVEGISGVQSASHGGKYTSIFGDDWSVIRQEWGLAESVSRQPRINSGIVYFNNSEMKNFRLLEKTFILFNRCIELNIPRKGDDSLFSLLQYVYKEDISISHLPLVYNYVLQFTPDRSYPIPDLVFFHFSIDKPWKVKPYEHVDKSIEVYNPLVAEWLGVYKKINYSSYVALTGADYQIKQIKVVDSIFVYSAKFKKLALDFYHWIDGRKYDLISRGANTRKVPLNLYWWQDYSKGIHNFGDEVTRDVIFKLFGYRSELADIDTAEIAGAGSILELLGERTTAKPINIWGSGFIMPKVDSRPYNDSSFVIHAVRGNLTLNRFDSSSQKINTGDPGLLAGLVYPKSIHRSDKIGVVVHYIEKDLAIVKLMKSDPRLLVINPLDSPDLVAKKISSCRMILSSSLHGLIFADSYRIPNVHVQFSERVTGGDYKFKDYYSATGREYRSIKAESIFDDNKLKEVFTQYEKVSQLRYLQKRLVKSFPKNLR